MHCWIQYWNRVRKGLFFYVSWLCFSLCWFHPQVDSSFKKERWPLTALGWHSKLSSHSASFADSSGKSWGCFSLSPAWVLSPSQNGSLWPGKRICWYSWIWVVGYHLNGLGKSPQRKSMLWLGLFVHFLFPLASVWINAPNIYCVCLPRI